jgi:hypothetical protein
LELAPLEEEEAMVRHLAENDETPRNSRVKTPKQANFILYECSGDEK